MKLKILFILLIFTTLIAYSRPTIKVLVNGGSQYTDNSEVSIDIFLEGIQKDLYKLNDQEIEAQQPIKMSISDMKYPVKKTWLPFQNEYTYVLNSQEGQYTIYVEVMFVDGSIRTGQDAITIDRTAPESGSILILPRKDTKEKFIVDLKLGAISAEYVKISNKPDLFDVPWRLFKRKIDAWQLTPPQDGLHTVYVSFKDVAGNQTSTFSSFITIDREGPLGGGIEVNKGNNFFNRYDRKLDVELVAREATFMTISQEKDFPNEKWIPYQKHFFWTLQGEEGIKRIYVKYKDDNNNQTGVLADSIIFDITAPIGSIVINDDNEETQHYDKLVNLKIAADPGTKLMMISNSSGFVGAKWQLVRKEIHDWKLEGEENGLRHVYIRFQDRAGNTSATFKDSITLKRKKESSIKE